MGSAESCGKLLATWSLCGSKTCEVKMQGKPGIKFRSGVHCESEEAVFFTLLPYGNNVNPKIGRDII